MRSLQAKGQRIQALDDKPVLYEDLTPIWNAYLRLDASRPHNGWAPCAIPISEVSHLLDLWDVHDPDVRQEYLHLIGEVDREYLKTLARERKGKPNADPRRSN